MWMDDAGAYHTTEQLARRADLVIVLTQVIEGPSPDKVAEAIVSNFQAIKAVIKDRSNV